MSRRRWSIVLVWMVVGPVLARGSDRAGAAAAPAADPSTPVGALRQFYEATEAGDVAAVRAALHATGPEERALADAYAGMLTAARGLGEAMKGKFNATGDALSKGLPMRDLSALLPTAEVKVEGDGATVALKGQPRPVRLVRADGRWRLPVADYAGVTPETIAGQTAVLTDMATAFSATTAEINAGKFPAPQEAARALQQRLQAVIYNTLQKHPPATGPATTRPGN